MFGTLGMQEILLLMGVALLIFGHKRLPEIGRTLGKALGEFRRATTDLKRTLEYEADQEERRSKVASSSAQSSAALPAPRAEEPSERSSPDESVAQGSSELPAEKKEPAAAVAESAD